MAYSHFHKRTLLFLLLTLVAPSLLPAQTTTINVGSTVIQSPVKRFGLNIGTPNYYDSGQITKNLVFINPSFEGEIYQSTIECGTGTANSCSDANIYAGFTTNFWLNASYTVISGAAAGRSGTICSFSGAEYPNNGGVYTFCDSGTAPANGDYIVVKTTMPADLGWPNGDWQTVVGAGTLTAETTDLPPGTLGKQSALLTAPTGNDSISVNTFFDTTKGKSFVQLNGQYQLTFKAKGVSGNQNVAVSLTRGTSTFISQTFPLTNSWATYTATFTGTENGTATGNVELSFKAAGPDTIELDDVSLMQTGTDPTNTTIFRDEVVQAFQNAKPGVIRYWVDQLGESLDNLLTPATGRQRSGYTPYAGYDGENILNAGTPSAVGTFQTQTVKIGLTEILQLCQKVGADPWIVMPSTLSTGEAYSLMDYLAGPSTTTYGAIRAAAGQTAPWTSVFKTIHLEFGNEEWNGGTFKGGAIELGNAYGSRASAIFTAIKGNPSYVQSQFDLIINGHSTDPYGNQYTQSFLSNNDSFSIAPYMMYNVNSWDTYDKLFGTTFAEAEAFVTPGSSSEGVSGGFITEEQNPATGPGKPIVTSEMNLSPVGDPPEGGDGPMTQAIINGYASSVGGGVAVLDSMLQQLRAGVLTQNLFALPGYETATQTGTTAFLWGAVVDMGVTNLKRPQYLALQMANEAIGSNTQMLQTTQTGTNPTDSQYDYGLNTVTLASMHFIQSFAFSGSGTNSVVVFNVSPDYAEPINFAGANAPTGTVNIQQLWSANPTDNNETSAVVVPTSSTVSNFNPSSTISLPPYSMTVFTWGAGTQAAPQITGVNATQISSTSATITWTTDQAATSQVSYGTTSSYGSQSAVNSNLVTSHSVVLSGLTPGTTYDYAAISANSSNLSTTSGNFTFSTTAAAPVISAISVNPITSTTATVTWTTSQPSSSQVNYGTTTGYGSSSTLNASLVTSHSVTLTGLTAGTTYDFDVVSTNGSSLTATSPNSTFTTSAAVPPVISAVASGLITSTSATITWTTDQASSSQVKYGTTTSYGTSSTLNANLVTSHTVALSGLTPGTTYDFEVISTSSANATATSTNYTFTTTAVAPVISAVSSTVLSSTSATITWTTDQPSSSLVNYGTTTGYGSASTLNSSLVTSHSVTLTGLTAGTTYDFDVVSTNSSSLTATSPNSSFVTTAAPPTISAVASGLITSTSATITWTTNQPSSSQVKYGTTTGYGTSSTLNASLVTSHTVALSGLTPGTTYDFEVISTNGSNVTATSANFTFTTTAVAPVISAVTSTVLSSTSATITWTTDQPSSSLVNYGTTTGYGSSSTLNSNLVTSHSVTLTGLTPGTTYDFDVVSTNSSSLTATSPNSSFMTTAVPPTISAVASGLITSTSATITWTTDQASSSQVKYGTTTGYGTSSTLNASLVTSHTVALSGLTPGTTYDFEVISTNGSNATATSANFTFTTIAVAPVISAVSSTVLSSTSATITWTTDQPSSSLVNYGTTTGYGSASTLNSSLVTSHSVTLTGLTAGTTYDFDVVSTNSSSLTATSPNSTFVTTAAPPTISAVASGSITSTSVTITWTTNQPSSSQVNYGTTTGYGSSSTLNSNLVTSHSVTLTGLTQGTTYDFDVVSTNASSLTATSPNSTFATTAVAPVISNVATSALTSGSVTITWTTDQASSSLVNFGTTTGYGSSSTLNTALTTSHSVTLTGLTGGTTYDFDVVSANANNLSSTSANSTFTTTVVVAPAPYVGYLAYWGVSNTDIYISWSTDQLATTQLAYGTTTALGQLSPLQTTLQNSHYVVLTTLSPGTTYYFVAQSTNASGVTGYSTTYTFTTTGTSTTPAPVISSVASSGVTSTSATITWTTDEASSSQVNYGTTSGYGSSSTANSSLVTSHSVTLTGLTPGTTYDFDVVSANSSSISSTSTNYSFTTTGTVAAPVISNVATSALTSSSVTITWTTDQASSSLVNFGTTTGYGSSSTLSSSLVTSHSVTLTGLTAGTTYDFDVVSANASSLSSTSGNSTFATSAATGPAPYVGYLAYWGVSNTNIYISWSTDQTATTQLAYGTTTALGQLSPLQTTLQNSHYVVLTTLNPGTTYYFVAQSTNANGVTGYSTTYTFTTTGTPTTPAPVITAVASSSVTSSSATITWTTDQASSSQVNYGTTTGYGSSSAVNTNLVTNHSVTLTGLVAGTTYDFDVVSANSSSVSSTSGNNTFKTSGTVTAPVISNVATSALTSTSVTITWTTDQATSSLVNYGTTTGYGSASTLDSSLVTSHSVTLTGLTAGTNYDFDVVSANSSSISSTSPNSTFATPVATGPAPVVSYVASWGANNTGITISWSTDQSATTQVAYGTTTALGQLSPLQPALATSHGVTLTTLSPGTTYYFVAQSTNAGGVTGYSTQYTFTTTGSAAPVISAVTVTPNNGNTATISWTTTTPTYSYVQYGTAAGSYGRYSPQVGLTTTPVCTLPYVPSGVVHYQLVSTDAYGDETVSADLTFIEP